jgi:hypothetical protein
MANQTIGGLNSIASPSSAGMLWVSDPNASPQDRSLTLAALLTYLLGKTWSTVPPGFMSALMAQEGVALSSTPYTLVAPPPKRLFLVTTGASAFVFNLPSAATMLLSGPVTIVKVDSGAGAVQIAPNGTDVLANAGNVSCYLGTQWQSITLAATVSGQWSVVGGVFIPHQTVDTDGTQYHLGKLKHLPLANTTNRQLYNATSGGPACPAAGAYTTAIQATGNVGIPAGAKAVRVRAYLGGATAGSGVAFANVAFTDNNGNAPTTHTAHPALYAYGETGAAGHVVATMSELDIPLNASGQFYVFNIGGSNVTETSNSIILHAIGYYMGD